MMEPKSTATIRALASLAELSANQLEDGVSVEEVIVTLRKAAEAVRSVVETEEFTESDAQENEIDLVQDLTPMDLSSEKDDQKKAGDNEVVAEADEPVLNAG